MEREMGLIFARLRYSTRLVKIGALALDQAQSR